ncbi:MAG TPA: TIGR00282 family metallophosphoesterase [Vicinamibacterales bacterium]|nr:TIGR00282 family metallophosphoesterase [Vicinamibacterales bacterium]
MKLLFLGDIVGRPGRDLVRRHVRALAAHHGVDFVIANGENAAGGAGITRENTYEILAAGVDVITTGNHVWDKRETLEFIVNEPRLLRPSNYPEGTPGGGSCVVAARNGVRVGVINVMGRVFLNAIDDPFRAARREIDRVKDDGAAVIFVDVHAETTSEKLAMSYYLDGLVAAVIGTHTHVQTADERILPGGTACLTDVGMTGPHDGVIGIEKAAIIARFTTGLPGKFETATGDPRLHGVVITADESTGKATAIERVALSEAQLKTITDHVSTGTRA